MPTSKQRFPFVACLTTFLAVTCLVTTSFGKGPLRVHPDNPRYFTDDSGKAILLVGSHTWNNLVDMAPADSPEVFDYDGYLDWLVARRHNFFRLWRWELLSWDTRSAGEKNFAAQVVSPHPWKRTGPGVALDGKPKFDLQQFNDEYFRRLRDRLNKAQSRGLYPSVMLFEGWGLQFCADGWSSHPFHPQNNINDIDGDLNGDGMGIEIHTGRSPKITELQRAYVRKVVETVNDFDNVLYEISNENHPPSTEWQYAMIRYIKQLEAKMPKQHPVGMTFQYKGGSNQTLLSSPADWISPNNAGGYRDDPPAGDGTKVIVSDTDHLWGIGGSPDWAWKSYLRGLNPIFMDPYDGKIISHGFGDAQCEPIRQALGLIARSSQSVDLASMTPRPELASTRFCLAAPGNEYLVYIPGGNTRITLKLAAGEYTAVWMDTSTGKELASQSLKHNGNEWSAQSPGAGSTLLHLRRVPNSEP